TEGEGGVCYPPTTRPLEVKAADIPVSVLAAVAAAKPAVLPIEKEKVMEIAKVEAAPMAAPSVPMVQTAASAPAPRTGLLLSLLLVFLAGMGASLTPCVYPMIPITMAIVGAKGGGKARGFALSVVLVLGMAVTYTTLGVLAAKSGAVFGAFAQKPAFLIPVSLLFAAFALSLFGAFEIALPSSLAMKLQGDGSRKGFGGAFLMGLVLGPLSAPCVGPVIGAVLVGIAQQGNVWLVVPVWANFSMWTLVMLAGAAVFGVFEPGVALVGQLRKGIAILMLALGVLLGIRAVETFLAVDLLPWGAAAATPKEEHAGWLEQDLEGALAKAKTEHKVVLVDIYAEWCAQCKELDEKTWPEAGVKQWLAQNAVAIRIDTDARRKDLATKLQIRSYPTVILLDAQGRELRRILGFQKPEAMKAWLEGK
ncbi:MAG TPA: cytochrome c biogenesis protein CcdA, partial [Geothrix sp.]